MKESRKNPIFRSAEDGDPDPSEEFYEASRKNPRFLRSEDVDRYQELHKASRKNPRFLRSEDADRYQELHEASDLGLSTVNLPLRKESEARKFPDPKTEKLRNEAKVDKSFPTAEKHGQITAAPRISRAQRFPKGACENCGAMSHDKKFCMERPRKVGARFTNTSLAHDEKLKKTCELDYAGKRDGWKDFDASSFQRVREEQYQAMEDARKKHHLKKLSSLNDTSPKVDKTVPTIPQTFRNREDTAKYLFNLDVNSAYYDPKTRSMREDPLPNTDVNDKFYAGDNQYRNSGQAAEFNFLGFLRSGDADRYQELHEASDLGLSTVNLPLRKESEARKFPDPKTEKLRNEAKVDKSFPTAEKHGQITAAPRISRAQRFPKGACENCGAMSHDKKFCMERPRKVGARFTNTSLAHDEKLKKTCELDYAGKRDGWKDFDASSFQRVREEQYQAMEDARKKHHLKKLSSLNDTSPKVDKTVPTIPQTFRNREDTAKYLFNLDVNSAYYDPKTRSMREDPLPNTDVNDKFYAGDNQYRNSGQAAEFNFLGFLRSGDADRYQELHEASDLGLSTVNLPLRKESEARKFPDPKTEKLRNEAKVDKSFPTAEKHGQITAAPRISRAQRFPKGACENCGAMSHDKKFCMERPRKVGARFTNTSLAHDEKLKKTCELDYAGKRDGWKDFDASSFQRVREEQYQAMEDARKKHHLKKLSSLNDTSPKVDKTVPTIPQTFWNREDTAKYLFNLDVNSAYYDPKTRSMREDPLPNTDVNDKFYAGDNQYRNSGQAAEFNFLGFLRSGDADRYQELHEASDLGPSTVNLPLRKESEARKFPDPKTEKLRNEAKVDKSFPTAEKHGQITAAPRISRAQRFPKGACENCGAMSHDKKFCMERPRKVGARFTNTSLAHDEKLKKTCELDYAGKRDGWKDFDASSFQRVREEQYQAMEDARKKHHLKKLSSLNDTSPKVDKTVPTIPQTFRNREDTAKYLFNLDVNSANSAYYDPKTRSMREDPLPNTDVNDKFYAGDNQYRNSGQAAEFNFLEYKIARRMQAAPTESAFSFKDYGSSSSKEETSEEKSPKKKVVEEDNVKVGKQG